MKQILKFKNQRGQSLIEMLVGISIVIVSLLGILVLVNRSLGLNRVTAENYIATYLASEGIELTRNFFEKDYLAQSPGSKNFYGWVGGGLGNIAPTGPYGLYEIDFDEDTWPATVPIVGACGLSGTEPNEAAIRKLLSDCTALHYLRFHAFDGTYSYNNPADPETKFKRVIIIDDPVEFASIPLGNRLDFRVTSAVGWESRGGKFVVQLQDHFLPWRIP